MLQEIDWMDSILASGFVKLFCSTLLANFVLQRGDDAAGGLAACGCLGAFGFIIISIIALNVALLVWVARDAKNRGMDSAILWMILVMLTGIIGLIIYLLTRPQGNLVACPHCGNKRMQVSAKCPHCGNA
jgi:phospholipase D-like protein